MCNINFILFFKSPAGHFKTLLCVSNLSVSDLSRIWQDFNKTFVEVSL